MGEYKIKLGQYKLIFGQYKMKLGQYKIMIRQNQVKLWDSTWWVLQQIQLNCGYVQVEIGTVRDDFWTVWIKIGTVRDADLTKIRWIFGTLQGDKFKLYKVNITNTSRWYPILEQDDKWANYWGMKGWYFMPHTYRLGFYFWCLCLARAKLTQFKW